MRGMRFGQSRFGQSRFGLGHIILLGLAVSAVIFLIRAFEPVPDHCGSVSLPRNFTVEEDFSVFSHAFSVKANGQTLGSVEENKATFTRRFIFKDAAGEPVANAEVSGMSWGTEIKIYDCKGVLIGSLHEKVGQSLLGVVTQYAVNDASGSEIANSEKVSWGATSFTLTNKSGAVIAKLSRPAWAVYDTWSVELSGGVDPRIAVMIGAFKTAADNSK